MVLEIPVYMVIDDLSSVKILFEFLHILKIIITYHSRGFFF